MQNESLRRAAEPYRMVFYKTTLLAEENHIMNKKRKIQIYVDVTLAIN
jgi:hypothetical protein